MPKQILVVDDIEGVRREMSYLLEENGYSVIQAENGHAAYEKMVSQPIDLVITDILMPEMDGFELSSKLHSSFPHVKIIAISGGGNVYSSKLQGVDDLLRQVDKIVKPDAIFKKPFENEMLLAEIKLILAE